MFLRIKYTLALLLALAMLTSCGGSDGGRDNGTIDPPDLSIASLTLSGGELDTAFSSGQTGPYRVEVASDVEEIQLNITMSVEQTLTIQAVRSGATEVIDVTPGTAFTVPVAKGESILFIRIQDSSGLRRLQYQFTLHRESDEASLRGFNFDANNGPLITSTEAIAFDPEVLSYSMDAPYTVCSLGVIPFTNERHTTVTVNGQAAAHSVETFVDLVVGSNAVEIETVSEDESATRTYTLSIERAESTDLELASDTRLSALTLSAGTLSTAGDQGFHCGLADYTTRVNNDQASIEITATAVNTSAPIKYGQVSTAEDGSLVISDPEDASSGVAFSVDLDEGVNSIGISVNPVGSAAPVTYRINITRSNTNWVQVSTGAELQLALQNAVPNQEIVLAAGTYTASSLVADSGMEGVHFYSAASGTEEEPIILRAAGIVDIQGSATGTALQLSGDYWRAFGLRISNAMNGLVLDAASNNWIDSTTVTNIGERGVEVRNGSHDNAIQRLRINNTGTTADSAASEYRAEALVVGSDELEWNTAPTPGLYEPENNNNVFSNLNIGPSVPAELVDINEGATGTVLQFGIFDSASVTGSAENSAAIVSKGNDTEISFSNFHFSGSEGISALVSLDDASGDWHSEAWGENARLHNNRFDFNGASAPVAIAASAEIASASAINNENTAEGALSFSGAAISTSGAAPLYQIQSVADEPQCLLRESADINLAAEGQPENIRTYNLVLIGECDSSDSRLWRFQNTGDNEVLVYAATSNSRLAPILPDFTSETRQLALFDEETTSLPLDSFMSFWYVNFVDSDQIQLSNKHYTAMVVTRAGITDAFGTGNDMAVTAINLNVGNQRFRIVEQ